MPASRPERDERGRRRRGTPIRGFVVAVLLGGLLLAGCEPEYRVIRSGWDDFPQDPSPNDAQVVDRGEGWTIALHQFTGPRHQAEARRLVRRLEDEVRLSELWIGATPGASTIYRGRYANQREAQRSLQRVQRISLDGERRFAAATLAPLGRSQHPASDPHDLRQFPGRFSLQIGYYDDDYPRDRRDAAEQAVEQLRELGHEAYFYHGPTMSIVGIGVWEYEAAFVTRDDPRQEGTSFDVYGPRIRQLQQEFPYSLANADDLIEQQQREQPRGTQSSGLVEVF